MDIESLVENVAPWKAMQVERYVAQEIATGQKKITKQGNVYWRQIRPFFYRPLPPFLQYDLESTTRDFHLLAGFQHGVLNGQPSNSGINLMIFDEVGSYSAGKLHHSVLGNVKRAIKNHVTVRCLTDVVEFSEKGHEAYLSFYERTRYEFATYRLRPEGFARWARALFEFPELLILGAFSGEKLIGYEISCRVLDVLVLKAAVHSDLSLKLRAPDLLLHLMRMRARESGDIAMIYDSCISTPGINQFKIRRGARVATVPAHLHMNRLLLRSLKVVNKARYLQVVGYEAEPITPRAA